MAALGRAVIARIETGIIPSMPNAIREMWFHDAGKFQHQKNNFIGYHLIITPPLFAFLPNRVGF